MTVFFTMDWAGQTQSTAEFRDFAGGALFVPACALHMAPPRCWMVSAFMRRVPNNEFATGSHLHTFFARVVGCVALCDRADRRHVVLPDTRCAQEEEGQMEHVSHGERSEQVSVHHHQLLAQGRVRVERMFGQDVLVLAQDHRRQARRSSKNIAPLPPSVPLSRCPRNRGASPNAFASSCTNVCLTWNVVIDTRRSYLDVVCRCTFCASRGARFAAAHRGRSVVWGVFVARTDLNCFVVFFNALASM